MRLIGLCGPAGSGKDTAAGIIRGTMGWRTLSFAEPLYAALSTMLSIPVDDLCDRSKKEAPIEWLGASPRRLLQTLGTEWGRNTIRNDIWITIARRQIEQLAADGVPGCVFSDVRFDNEAEMIRSMGGEVWRIVRNAEQLLDQAAGRHVSEQGVSDDLVDAGIYNTGDLPYLARQIEGHLARQYHAEIAASAG